MRNLKAKSKGKYIAKGVLFGVVAGAAFTIVLMLLWNWLMPAIFGLGIITFWQALGLLALSKILFGGARHPRSKWQDREKAKMHREHFSERFKKAHSLHHDKVASDERVD